ncbi:MAG: hypothetical protein EAZ92_00850, partial [Candidatus Kapaibacterium sp.]
MPHDAFSRLNARKPLQCLGSTQTSGNTCLHNNNAASTSRAFFAATQDFMRFSGDCLASAPILGST